MIEAKKVFSSIAKNGVTPKTSADGLEVNSVVWRIPADLPYFAGHFPGTPVFPAIGILDASLVLLQNFLDNSELRIQAVESAKFLNLIGPEMQVCIEWHSLDGKSWLVEWKDASSSEILSSLEIQI